jgi:hypothetical protein
MIANIQLTILLVALAFNGFSQEETEISLRDKNNNKGEKVYNNLKVDSPAIFKNSNNSTFSFYRKYSRLKVSNIKIDEKSTYFNLFIDEKGCPYKVTFIKSLGNEYDEEVNRIIDKMPLWIPAVHKGEKVKVCIVEYITFQ